jgi:peptidoglycan/xylan/chitin deacetylase (PgdA/CDA1 family)
MKGILTFHSLDRRSGPLSYTPDDFARLLDGLAASDLPILSLDDLLNPATRRGVAVTFDDGMASLREAALPVLRDRKFVAHLYLAVGAVGGDNRWQSQPRTAPTYRMLDWDGVADLVAAGVLVEAHTMHHPDLRTLSDAGIDAEFAQADAEIARRTGRRPVHFAYPYGFLDPRVEARAAARYASAVTTQLRWLRPGDRRSALPRLDSHYLRAPFVRDHPGSARARAYLGLRGAARRVRSTFWIRSHA